MLLSGELFVPDKIFNVSKSYLYFVNENTFCITLYYNIYIGKYAHTSYTIIGYVLKTI